MSSCNSTDLEADGCDLTPSGNTLPVRRSHGQELASMRPRRRVRGVDHGVEPNRNRGSGWRHRCEPPIRRNFHWRQWWCCRVWCCVGRNAITDTGAVGTLSAPDSGQGHAHGARTLESGHVSEKVRKSQQGQHALSSPRAEARPLSGRKDRSVIRSN